jgi:AcrR family transcriptional regulator
MSTTATEPRRLPKSETTIATILEQAASLFLATNYSDVTMNDIARAGKLTKGALYHHFVSKEELYLAMMHAHLGRLRELFAGAMADQAGCRDRLRSLTCTFLTLPPERRDIMKLVRRDINVFTEPARSDLIRAYQRCLPEQVEAVLREGIAQGEIRPADPRLLSWQFVAAVEVTLADYSDRVFHTLDQKLEFVTALFFDGAGRPGSKGANV